MNGLAFIPFAGILQLSRSNLVLLAGILLFWLSADAAFGHELRLAYLQITETGPGDYSVFWKVPARGENLRLGLSVQFPAHCAGLTSPSNEFAANAHTQRWTIHCKGGLRGGNIEIQGLGTTSAEVLVRLENQDGTSQSERLDAASPSLPVKPAENSLQIASTYLGLGIEHILLGADHLLFVWALLMTVNGVRRLVATVTGFTIAHSITLAAASLGIIQVPSTPVEATIALSIVFVAREILRLRQGHASLAASAPWLVAFVFGLLHGFGFASALREVGLPQIHIPLALLCFNLGVEIGQLVFITTLLGAWRIMTAVSPRLPPWLEPIPAYAIGGTAMFWLLQRLALF